MRIKFKGRHSLLVMFSYINSFSCLCWPLKTHIGQTIKRVFLRRNRGEEESFTLSTILLSDVGVRPTQRANLQGSPSTCSVTPNSDVWEYRGYRNDVRRSLVMLSKMRNVTGETLSLQIWCDVLKQLRQSQVVIQAEAIRFTKRVNNCNQ